MHTKCVLEFCAGMPNLAALRASSARVNPRPGRAFSITRPGRGGSRCDPPGVLKLSVVALREDYQTIAPMSTRDWWYIFGPRSTFDLVMAGQRSIFGEIDVFFRIYKTIVTEL